MNAARKPSPDPDDVRREMLEHLDDHPPPERPPKPPPAPKPAKPQTTERPRLMLRKLRVDPALDRLATFLRAHQQKGTPEVLVIVGKGHGSPGGEPVIGPAVRDFCERRSDLVVSITTATAADGGSGALVVRLRPR